MKYSSAIAVTFVLLLSGCQTEIPSTMEVTKPVANIEAFNKDQAPTVSFSVPDMMCEQSCAVKVREALETQPGVKEVLVDFPAKTATVAIDENIFDSDQAIATLVDYQFTESQVIAPTTDMISISSE